MRAKNESPSPAQRQEQAGAPESKSIIQLNCHENLLASFSRPVWPFGRESSGVRSELVLPSLPQVSWTGAACSDDGTKLVALGSATGIWVSTNRGATWTVTDTSARLSTQSFLQLALDTLRAWGFAPRQPQLGPGNRRIAPRSESKWLAILTPLMETQPTARTRQRILVVDDNLVVLKVLSFKLTSNGYDVLAAVDGSEAIAAVRTKKPDLILLDLNFPPDVGHGGGVPWDGFLIIEWLRLMDEGTDIPIFVITGNESAKNDQRALAAGVRKVFHKPLDHAALLVAIGEALGPASAPT